MGSRACVLRKSAVVPGRSSARRIPPVRLRTGALAISWLPAACCRYPVSAYGRPRRNAVKRIWAIWYPDIAQKDAPL